MANPQKENGYTPIANDLFEAFARNNIPSSVRRIIDFVIRKTYGFNKKEDSISIDQFMDATGLARRTIIYAIQEGEAKNMLIIKRLRSSEMVNEPNVYRLNKDYDTWVVQKSAPQVEQNREKALLSYKNSKEVEKEVVQKSEGSAKVCKKVVQKSVNNVNTFAPTKDTTKDKIQKTGEEIEQARTVRDIIEGFSFINPACKKMYGNKAQRQACLDLVEEYTFEKVMLVVTKTLPKTNAKEFFPTIITPYQLFQDWSRLEAAIMKYKGKVENKTQGRGLA